MGAWGLWGEVGCDSLPVTWVPQTPQRYAAATARKNTPGKVFVGEICHSHYRIMATSDEYVQNKYHILSTKSKETFSQFDVSVRRASGAHPCARAPVSAAAHGQAPLLRHTYANNNTLE